MAEFVLDGIRIAVADRLLTDDLRRSLEDGSYEGQEARALKANLVPDDTVLDLGAGLGFIAIQAARIVGGRNVTCVEAMPELLDMLRANLDANRGRRALVLHAAVVGDDHGDETVAFASLPAFWSSRLARDLPDGAAGIRHTVTALRISRLLDEVRPSVVIMDVEGAEIDLCRAIWPASVRLLMIELHQRSLPPADIKAVFDALSRAGFAYRPKGSDRAVVVFQRVNLQT